MGRKVRRQLREEIKQKQRRRMGGGQYRIQKKKHSNQPCRLDQKAPAWRAIAGSKEEKKGEKSL